MWKLIIVNVCSIQAVFSRITLEALRHFSYGLAPVADATERGYGGQNSTTSLTREVIKPVLNQCLLQYPSTRA